MCELLAVEAAQPLHVVVEIGCVRCGGVAFGKKAWLTIMRPEVADPLSLSP